MKNNLYKLYIVPYNLKYFLRIMKLCLLLTILFTSSLFANNANSQNAKVNIPVSSMTTLQLIKTIESQTKYLFVYNENEIDINRKVQISGSNHSVSAVLKEVFNDTDLTYDMEGNNIMIMKRSVKQSPLQTKTKKISGIIVDDTGAGVIGATVKVSGSDNGTITDFEGKFTITVSLGNKVEVSYIGYQTTEFVVKTNSEYRIVLKEDTQALEEVVIVGFGTQKKENLTGAVAMVSSDAFISRANSSATEMLQGELPGLNVYTNGGSLDSNPDLNIRGLGTIGKGSEGSPLVLIDGMEGDINTLNPQDIESVSVLKDAAASSIYGSRAPFGVILIKTKEGSQGRTNINYTANLRWSSPTNLPSMMDSYTFMTFLNDAQINQGKGLFFQEEVLQRVLDYQNGKITTTTIPDPKNLNVWGSYKDANANVDWYDVMYKDVAFSQEHNLSVSGGSDRINYYASGNYNHRDGFMNFNADFSKRYSLNAKFSAKLTDWITLSVNERFVRNEFKRPTYLNNNYFQALARQGWPNLPVYDPNGYMFAAPSPALNIRDGGDLNRQVDLNYHQIQLTIEPIKAFKVFSEFNYRTTNFQENYSELITYNHNVKGEPYAFSQVSGLNESYYRENYMNLNIYGEYATSISKKHNLKLMAGFQIEEENKKNVKAYKNGIMVPESPYLDTTNGYDYNGNFVAPVVGGGFVDWATAGFFGRVNYDYEGRYLTEVNMRYDGSSRFRANDRWALFPSFSLGWNLAHEKFWGNLSKYIGTFKLRGSYGTLGNQLTTNYYPTYPIMNTDMGVGNWLVGGLKPNISSAPDLVSSNLTWETIKNWNIGIDFGCFENRLTGSFDLFNRSTYDMVGPARELPVVLGTDVPMENNTDLSTKGWELSLKWRDRLRNGLGYSVSFHLSDAKTKILSYPNEALNLDSKLYRTGQMYGEIWGYKTIGIAKSQEEMDAHLASLPHGGQDALGNNWNAGDIMYADLNGDGKIDSGANTETNHGDLMIIGNETPRYNFAINLAADWKGFDIRVFFQGVMKRDYFQNGYYFWGNDKNVWWSTGFKEHKDYFRLDESHPLGQNLSSYYPRPIFGTEKNKQVQSRYLQDASYIRLKNLQIGYTIPARVVRKIGIQNLRVYFSGENLWTGTKLSSIFDPELLGKGYNGNAYPLSRTLSMGISVNF